MDNSQLTFTDITRAQFDHILLENRQIFRMNEKLPPPVMLNLLP